MIYDRAVGDEIWGLGDLGPLDGRLEGTMIVIKERRICSRKIENSKNNKMIERK